MLYQTVPGTAELGLDVPELDELREPRTLFKSVLKAGMIGSLCRNRVVP